MILLAALRGSFFLLTSFQRWYLNRFQSPSKSLNFGELLASPLSEFMGLTTVPPNLGDGGSRGALQSVSHSFHWV